jgi:hypothetical protein
LKQLTVLVRSLLQQKQQEFISSQQAMAALQAVAQVLMRVIGY